ncbi:MAG: hypothetical protein JNL32_03805 [Candidatus Kapabacteria bacterium]|nr:hypothetical protein [Candidatus Kapabacteria bacterium]
MAYRAAEHISTAQHVQHQKNPAAHTGAQTSGQRTPAQPDGGAEADNGIMSTVFTRRGNVERMTQPKGTLFDHCG